MSLLELNKRDEPATYQQRRLLLRLTKDWTVMDREMTAGEAGTWIRRLQGKTCKAERIGRNA